jgi:plasmid stabilization system protein ParE
MVEGKYDVVWTKRSQKHLIEAFEYISKDSPKNAAKVLDDIMTAVYKLASNPEKHNPDKFKINNDGSYRAFEKHSYRIAYRFSKNIIRVLRVRHTSMEPLKY